MIDMIVDCRWCERRVDPEHVVAIEYPTHALEPPLGTYHRRTCYCSAGCAQADLERIVEIGRRGGLDELRRKAAR